MRIVQTDSGSDSDSESWNKNEEIIPVNRLTPTVFTDPPEPATTIHICTVKQRTFFVPTGADSRNWSQNLNLPALYALRRVAPTLRIGDGTWICLHYMCTLRLYSVKCSGGKKLSTVSLGHSSLRASTLAVETTTLSQNGLHHTSHPLMWHHIPEEQRSPLCWFEGIRTHEQWIWNYSKWRQDQLDATIVIYR
jgi:hypothetical protein